MEIFRDCPEGLVDSFSGLRIGIAGAGGIGSNVAMLLVRAGASSLVVVDFDSVEPQNLNRQFFFADQTGMQKVDALAANLLRINPDVKIDSHSLRLTGENACSVFEDCDILVEAVDDAGTKVLLIEEWSSGLQNKPVIACSGIAGVLPLSEIRTERTGCLSVVGDHHSSQDDGTFSARVMAVAAAMVAEIHTIITRGKCSACPGCRTEGDRIVLLCNGERVPLIGFPAKMIEGTVRGMMSSLKGVDSTGSVELLIN